MTGGARQVLALLRESGESALSGAELSERLDVSRTQIWKHVEGLRKRGYEISGEPGGGYRLDRVPDRLYPEELRTGLETHWIAREVEYLESTDSTNLRAYERARAGAPAGSVVVAESQTAGRGRLGRSFFSPPNLNLYTSIVLRPQMTIAEAPTLILTAAAAVADSVAETLEDDSAVEIKWPNDVLLAGLKTSGILMELSAEATRIDFAILGIGVNLNVDRGDFPDEFRELATSLRSHSGRPVDRAGFARRLYGRLEELIDLQTREGFEAVRPHFESRFRMPGREVTVHQMDGSHVTGITRGLGASGELELETAEGELVRVIAGDVTLGKEQRAS